MKTRQAIGWRTAWVIALLGAAAGRAGAQDAAVVTEAPAVPAAGAEVVAGPERIELVFTEPEQDILPRAAGEKLDAPIESLEFANADLRNVIRIIGERLDINFIFDTDEISGAVTLRLRNVRLRDALDSILKTRRLAIIVDPSGIFRIVPQEQINRKLVETRTEVIQLNWIRSEDVEKTMQPFLSSEEDGKLVANIESNSIIVTDVPPQIQVIRDLISRIDIPERQVQIEARLIDINIGAARELKSRLSVSKLNEPGDTQDGRIMVEGVDSEGIPQLGLVGIPMAEPLGVVNNLLEGFSAEKGKGTLAFGEQISLFGNDFALNAAFTALESRNVVEILANPKVTTLNNVPANISIIEKIPYLESVQGPSQGTLTAEVEFEKAGVEIMVRPIVTPNDFVRLQIDLSQKIFRERVGGGELDPPAIDERMAKTNVIVEDGATVVLGGLRQMRRLEGVDGVPWLHRVPLFGWLFKDKIHDQSKTELVLMLTPRIIKAATPLTEREQEFYDKIDKNWDLPDYMMDDVSNHDDLKEQNRKRD